MRCGDLCDGLVRDGALRLGHSLSGGALWGAGYCSIGHYKAGTE